MSDDGSLQAFRAREQALWRAETRFDQGYMERILHPDFVEFGRSGRVYTRAETLAVEPVPLDVRLREFAVHAVVDDVALVTDVSIAGGQHASLEGNRRSLWVHQGSSWLLRFHQGTPT